MVRLRKILLEHLSGPFELAGVDRHARQPIDVHETLRIAWIDAYKRRRKRGVERFASGENSHLRSLGIRLGMKTHCAAAKKHETGDASLD